MDEDAAAALVRRWWVEVWQDGRVDVIDEIVADPIIRHSSLGTEVTKREKYKAMLLDFQRVLHRPATTVDDFAVVGDRIWMRATSRGINPETGQRSVVAWLIVQRIAEGRIAESWSASMPGVNWDN